MCARRDGWVNARDYLVPTGGKGGIGGRAEPISGFQNLGGGQPSGNGSSQRRERGGCATVFVRVCVRSTHG